MDLLAGRLVRLRPATKNDAEMVYTWATESDIAPYLHLSGEPVEPLEKFLDDYRDYLTDESPELGRLYVIVRQNALIGAIAYNDFLSGNRVELDIWMNSEKNCGKGYGSHAIDVLCRYLADQFAINTFMMQPSARNPRAIRAYEKAGFEIVPATPEAIEAEWGGVDQQDSVLMIRNVL